MAARIEVAHLVEPAGLHDRVVFALALAADPAAVAPVVVVAGLAVVVVAEALEAHIGPAAVAAGLLLPLPYLWNRGVTGGPTANATAKKKKPVKHNLNEMV